MREISSFVHECIKHIYLCDFTHVDTVFRLKPIIVFFLTLDKDIKRLPKSKQLANNAVSSR